jgi:hypothetical protein
MFGVLHSQAENIVPRRGQMLCFSLLKNVFNALFLVFKKRFCFSLLK